MVARCYYRCENKEQMCHVKVWMTTGVKQRYRCVTVRCVRTVDA